MIHHRPQGDDGHFFQRGNWIRSAAVAGSTVLSLRLPLGGCDIDITESSARNASIRIDREGRVFLTVPYFGARQDIYSSIPVLIAERLEVALNQVHLEYAPRKEGAAADEVWDAQAIDNSRGIRSDLTLLGKAAATARAMLIAAAAERWGTNARSCHAQEGEVIHTPTWRKLKYGVLTIDAAYRPIPTEV